MSDDYWLKFWKRHGRDSVGSHEQYRVFRTLNQQPISADEWQGTLKEVDRLFPISNNDRVLDLCAGNGLFTSWFASKKAQVTSVDISADLLRDIDERNLAEVTTLCDDMRMVSFPPESFTHIFLYAGLQYIDEAEVVELFRRMKEWLSPKGRIFLGDVPDLAKRWKFYNTENRRRLYFEGLKEGRNVVGTWFDQNWLQYLAEYTGFSYSCVIPQRPSMIYSYYRFDFELRR